MSTTPSKVPKLSKMSFKIPKVEKGWDVNEYRTAYEPKEHWDLKKEFLMTHRGHIPEDQLICLAQVYVNIVLLGCKYPAKVTEKVKMLSEGLGKKYHESRKNKLSRTFVSAADAASDKVRSLMGVKVSVTEATDPDDALSVANLKCFNLNTLAKLWYSSDPLHRFILIYRSYITPKDENMNALGLLIYSAQICRVPLQWHYDPATSTTRALLHNQEVESVSGVNKKIGKAEVAANLLKKLSNKCCLIVMKKRHSEHSINIDNQQLGLAENAQEEMEKSLSTAISDDNIGNKMLKMMGWKGGGLGKEGTGRAEPIEPGRLSGKQGIGYKGKATATDKVCNTEFKTKIHVLIKSFLRDVERGIAMSDELVFSPEFSKEQRACIHSIAGRYKLKSASTGKGDKRYLVLSLKHHFSHKLISMLEKEGSENDNFKFYMPGTYDVNIFS